MIPRTIRATISKDGQGRLMHWLEWFGKRGQLMACSERRPTSSCAKYGTAQIIVKPDKIAEVRCPRCREQLTELITYGGGDAA